MAGPHELPAALAGNHGLRLQALIRYIESLHTLFLPSLASFFATFHLMIGRNCSHLANADVFFFQMQPLILSQPALDSIRDGLANHV